MTSQNIFFLKLEKLLDEGKAGAIATVIETKGSTPGKTGFKMIILEEGVTVGTIGGGCVELGVTEIAKEVIKDGKFRTFGLSLKGKDASCGGWMNVMIESFSTSAKKI